MLYAFCMSMLAFICLNAANLNCLDLNNERTKMSSQVYSLTGKDKYNQSVVIEWQKTTLVAPEFAVAMASVWDIAQPAYLPVEINFLKAFPGVVGKEPYFKVFEPLFKDGIECVDWVAVEKSMIHVLKNHFVFDVSKFSTDVIKVFGDDECYFATVKDGESCRVLGFITALVRKGYAQGDVKIMSFAVDSTYQNRGLGKLLMSVVFKMVPELKRIFLCTRVTNEVAVRAYQKWGFVADQNPILDHAFNLEHWIFMQYKVGCVAYLQEVAQTLV